MNCDKINLKKGSSGDLVKELQTILTKNKFYDGKIDGDFGTYTETSVKNFQKKYNLKQDGIFGPVSCKKLNEISNNTNTNSYYKNGVYHSGPHWIGSGCNKMGQCNGYYCACCSLRQQLAKQGIDKYTQSMIAGYAGTTTAGTSHYGIETAVATIARKEGIKIGVEWKNFSDLGSNQTKRFEALGKLISNPKKGVILHTLYKNRFGHYETVQEVNMNKNNNIILNSLGNKCNSPAYCGYKETRSFGVLATNLRGISQKSVCILTFP